MGIQGKVFPLSMKGIQGGPCFKTDIMVGYNGQEVRNALWQDALWKFNATFAVKKRADVDSLFAFFLNCYGREQAFLLEAGVDSTIGTSAAPVQIHANSSAGTYQLIKPYTDNGGNTYNRTILRPSPTGSDVNVYAGPTLLTPTTQYTYSQTTGVITVISGGGTGTPLKVWVKKFYTVVRFDVDDIDPDLLMWWIDGSTDKSQFMVPDIPMREVRDTA